MEIPQIRREETHKIPGYQQLTGLLGSYGTMYKEQIVRTFYIDRESLQYTRYETGQFYGWHSDAGLATHYKPQSVGNLSEGLANDFVNENIELVRKLSFSLQLSDPDDYEGGNVQFLDESDKSYFAPRKRGTIVLFDSRIKHRVLKVTKGTRKSIVGWVVGPRWR